MRSNELNKMNNTILFALVFIHSCAQRSQIEKDLCENINKTLHLEMFEVVRLGNNLLSFSELKQYFQ